MAVLLSISKIQGELLVEMYQSGEKLKVSNKVVSGSTTGWVRSGLEKSYRWSTIAVMIKAGFVKKLEKTDKTPWYRTDYELTERGKLLAQVLEPLLEED